MWQIVPEAATSEDTMMMMMMMMMTTTSRQKRDQLRLRVSRLRNRGTRTVDEVISSPWQLPQHSGNCHCFSGHSALYVICCFFTFSVHVVKICSPLS